MILSKLLSPFHFLLKILLIKYLFVYLFERQRDIKTGRGRQIYLPSWVRSEARNPGIPSWSPTWMAGTHTLGHHLHMHRRCISRKLGQERKWDFTLRHANMGSRCLSSSLTNDIQCPDEPQCPTYIDGSSSALAHSGHAQPTEALAHLPYCS